MKFGTNEIQKVYLGTTELNSLYFGANQVYTKGGFDEYTVAVFHLDGGDTHLANAVPGSATGLSNTNANGVTNTGTYITSNTTPKFGDRCAGYGSYSNSSQTMFTNLPSGFLSHDFTWDWWQKTTTAADTSDSYALMFSVNRSTVAGITIGLMATKVYCSGHSGDWYGPLYIKTGLTTTDSLATATWYHLAIEKYNGTFYLYVNGEMCYTIPGFTPTSATHSGMVNGFRDQRFDEIRLSSTARYKGQNFTPPTQPY